MFRGVGRCTAATLVALTLALAACGDEEDSDAEFPPAAGKLTPSSDTPGIPPDASYGLTGNEWDELENLERF